MAKYIRRKFKRTFKKRRFTRKRTMSRKSGGIKYDGMIKVKLQGVREMNNSDVTGTATFTVRWGHQLIGPVANEMNI